MVLIVVEARGSPHSPCGDESGLPEIQLNPFILSHIRAHGSGGEGRRVGAPAPRCRSPPLSYRRCLTPSWPPIRGGGFPVRPRNTCLFLRPIPPRRQPRGRGVRLLPTRHPERTSFYQLIEGYFDRYMGEYEERLEPRHGYLRPVVARTVLVFLECGRPQIGFVPTPGAEAAGCGRAHSGARGLPHFPRQSRLVPSAGQGPGDLIRCTMAGIGGERQAARRAGRGLFRGRCGKRGLESPIRGPAGNLSSRVVSFPFG